MSLIAGPPRGLNGNVDGNNLARMARLDLDSGHFEVTFVPLVIFLLLRTSVGGGDGCLLAVWMDGFLPTFHIDAGSKQQYCTALKLSGVTNIAGQQFHCCC